MKRHVVAGLIVAMGLASQASGLAHAQQPAPQPAVQPTPQPGPQPGPQGNQLKLAELRSARELQGALDEAAARETVPLQLQVVVARYQGEKRVSSMPYVLSINSASSPNQGSGSLRMGTRIAVPSTTVSEGKTTTTFSYQDIGTSVDAGAARRADGAFTVNLTVADSGVYPDDQKTSASSAGLPVIRSFQSTNRLILKDGQTAQFTAAADRLSGDSIRVEVTLRVQR